MDGMLDMGMHTQTGNETDLTVSQSAGDAAEVEVCSELLEQYQSLINESRFHWTTHIRFKRRLGRGGQGVVYLTEKKGADGFTVPVALKIFSPERYSSPAKYDEDMLRMGQIAAQVARIQNEHLVGVENFLDRNRVRMLVMEWVEGYDLRQLLSPKILLVLRKRVSQRRWQYLNDVVVTSGASQNRFKSGVAVAIVRHCLRALGALHRRQIVHGDVKPANIMLKRSGHAKIIDLGAAFDTSAPPPRLACTPSYAAVEVLEGETPSPHSDLASLGYVLIELLAGRQIFSGTERLSEMIATKRMLTDTMYDLLPADVTCNELLMSFCQGLVAADRQDRFPSAEAAELFDDGAAAFHRQLIKGDMASEYENDIRVWIEELLEAQELFLDTSAGE
jgi:serine/threonine-protein kinase